MRVLLTAGGWSSEREVSLAGARQIEQALKDLGHEVGLYDPALDFAGLPKRARRYDFVFINLHGSPGEDGLIQAMLDVAQVPYQGAGPASSFLALRKSASKVVFDDIGLKTPAWEFLPGLPEPDWKPALAYPFFAKPDTGGSSLGMTLVREQADLGRALATIVSSGDGVILEELVAGPEITCAVLGDRTLPLIEIRPPDDAEFFDYESKYTAGRTLEICPATIDERLAEKIRRASMLAHRALGASGCSRADFMVRDGVPYLLEINTLPGMTSTSLLPQAAAEAGLSFQDLIAELIRLGLEERGGKRQP